MKKITILLLIGAGLNAAMIHTMGPGAGAAPAGAGGPAQQQQRRIVPLKVKAARAAAQAWHDGAMPVRDLRALPRKFREEVKRQFGVIAARALHDQVRNAQYYFQLSPIMKAEIIRRYYLAYGEHAPDAFINNARRRMDRDQYVKQAYRFSIQELLDAGRIPEIANDRLDLKDLYIGSLDGLKNIPGIDGVRDLNLIKNQIQTISPGVFEGLANLKTLDLGETQIENITSGAFRWLANLRTLNLRGNQIRTIVPGAFQGLANLEDLNLFGNQIEAIPPGVFEGLANLGTLDLRRNHIKAIAPGAFQGLRNLRELYLDHNYGMPQEVRRRIRDELSRMVAPRRLLLEF